MKLLLFAGVLSLLALTGNALRCWVCENVRSNEECQRKGYLRQCDDNQQACQTEVRRVHPGILVSKRCKQAFACDNNFIQNPRPAWYPSQCNLKSPSSVCRCCCNEDQCNSPSLDCTSGISPCGPLGIPANGKRECKFEENMNERGSLCSFTCNSGYELIGSKSTLCAADGDRTSKWSNPVPQCIGILHAEPEDPCSTPYPVRRGTYKCTDENNVYSKCNIVCDSPDMIPYSSSPTHTFICNKENNETKWDWSTKNSCCEKPCPPYAFMDAVFVLDSTFSVGLENWGSMVNFTASVIKQFDVDSDTSRFSVMKFGVFPNQTSAIDFKKFAGNKTGLVKAVETLEFDESGATNIGSALKYVRQTLFTPEKGDRPNVTNVVIVITDGVSKDAVDDISEQIRDDGAETYAVGVKPAQGNVKLNSEQLLQISGSSNTRFVLEDFIALDKQFTSTLSKSLCGDPCRPTPGL